jgi:hypothetical protein
MTRHWWLVESHGREFAALLFNMFRRYGGASEPVMEHIAENPGYRKRRVYFDFGGCPQPVSARAAATREEA